MAGHTAAFDEFLLSFNGGQVYADALDLDAYERCTPSEKRELDALLERKLPDGDPRVAHAIAAMWPRERAVAVLRPALAASSAEARPGIERALQMALGAP